MKCHKIVFIEIILFFGLTCISYAEDYNLHYFLSKSSSKPVGLSKKEKSELFDQLDGVMKKAQGIRTKLIQVLQIGETDVQYQEGKFWMAKLEEDQGLIETGIQQIKLLKEKPNHLVASIRLYKSLKDLSSNFNTYNNLPSFSALVGDFAPEMELWAESVFYRLYLLPLARVKDVGEKPAQKKKSSVQKKKLVTKDKKPASKQKKP